MAHIGLMEQTRLGDLDLSVTPLGLGLAAVGRPAYITLGRRADFTDDRSPDAMYARSAALLDRAIEHGVRYLDAARSYGRSEEFVARWLEARVDPPTIGSKWGYAYTGGWALDASVHEQKELSLSRFRAQLEESRQWLGDALALYQIHSATIESGCLEDEDLLAALADGRRAGHYRAVGLTLSGPRSADTLAAALAATACGERVFDVVQATFNVLEPSLASVLSRAHDAGLGVIAKEVFANGRLTDANDRPSDAALMTELGAIGARYDARPDQIAVAFAHRQPFVDVVLSGAATTDQLDSHVGALALTLDAEDMKRLERLAETPATYWETRATLAWQ